MALVEWDELDTVSRILDTANARAASAEAVDVDELPDWEILATVARVIRFEPGVTKLRPCPLDLSKPYVVRFLNQTANKPLHLGHLRNSALGAAAAGTAAALGARVIRHCVIEDTGRFMSEAMAAFADLESSTGAAVRTDGIDKSDHFVGQCYVRYRRAITAHLPGGPTASTGYEARNDAADSLQRQMVKQDESAVRLWRIVRDFTLTGQQATLRDLGIAFDCCDYESTEDQYLDEFIARGFELGILHRNDADEVIYRPPRGKEVRLVNSIGLPEENCRLLSLVRRLLSTWPREAIHLIIAGSEWRASMIAYPGLMKRFGLGEVDQMYGQAFYGMVTHNGRKMSSSDGTGVLVDTFLTELAEDAAIAELVQRSDGRAAPAQFAALIIKSFLLAARRADSIEFESGLLRDRQANPGWTLADAWATTAPRDRSAERRPSEASRAVLEDALSRVSFERALDHAEYLARAIVEHSSDERELTDFSIMLDALALTPRDATFSFDDAPSLATMPRPEWLPR